MGSITSGTHSGACCLATLDRNFNEKSCKFDWITCCLLGEIRMKFLALVIRNIIDSTLYCEPRDNTEKKSIPNSLASSLHRINKINE
jgi:hypothetical protein